MRSLQFNVSLARGDVPDDCRQATVSLVFKKGENMMLSITDLLTYFLCMFGMHVLGEIFQLLALKDTTILCI